MTTMNCKPTSKPRLYFLDNLKTFIILLMVIFHVSLGYTTWNLPWWTVNDIYKHPFFDLFGFQVDVYIMPIMFMVAGYFAAPALFHKNITSFWQSKLRRVVIPWILGVLFIAPFIAYSTPFSRMDQPPSYFSYIIHDFFGPDFQQANFWFLGILTLFFLLLTVAYQLNPTYFKTAPQVRIPSLGFFPLFVLLSAMPFFLTNLFVWSDLWFVKLYIFAFQPVRLGLYLCYFALGVYGWHNAWFTPTGYKPKVLGWVSAMLLSMGVYVVYRIAFTLVPDMTALHKVGYAIVFSVFSLTATLGLIAIFYHFINSDAYLWRRLSANSYTIYIIHQCVVIPLAYGVQKLQLNVFVKFFGVTITSLVLCFLIAEYIITPILARKKRISTSSNAPIVS